MKLDEKFFKNKQEQVNIRLALDKAMPTNVHFHNIVIVLAEMLKGYTLDMVKAMEAEESE